MTPETWTLHLNEESAMMLAVLLEKHQAWLKLILDRHVKRHGPAPGKMILRAKRWHLRNELDLVADLLTQLSKEE